MVDAPFGPPFDFWPVCDAQFNQPRIVGRACSLDGGSRSIVNGDEGHSHLLTRMSHSTPWICIQTGTLWRFGVQKMVDGDNKSTMIPGWPHLETFSIKTHAQVVRPSGLDLASSSCEMEEQQQQRWAWRWSPWCSSSSWRWWSWSSSTAWRSSPSRS